MILRLEVNFSKNMILYSEDTATTYNFLEYDAVYDERYASMVGELYDGTTLINLLW